MTGSPCAAGGFPGQRSEFEFVASNGKCFESNFVPLPYPDGVIEHIMGIAVGALSGAAFNRSLCACHLSFN